MEKWERDNISYSFSSYKVIKLSSKIKSEEILVGSGIGYNWPVFVDILAKRSC